MIRKPQLKSIFRIERIEPNLVFLVSNFGTRILEGEAYYLLAPHLNGKLTVAELADELADDLSFLTIHRAILRMEDKGFIVEGDVDISAEIVPFIHSLDVNTEEASQRLAGTKVAVLAIGDVTVRKLNERLKNVQISMTEDVEQADFVIVVTGDYTHPRLKSLNQRFLKSKTPWILIRPQASELWIGPLFEVGETGCWSCLNQRLTHHGRVDQFLQRKRQTDRPLVPPALGLSMMEETAYNLVTLELLRWIATQENEKLKENLLELTTLNLEITKHRFIKRPQCPDCGDPTIVSRRQQKPLVLEPRPKRFTTDGGHRIMTPEQTYTAHKHHISHITGVVTALEDITGDTENDLVFGYGCGVNMKTTPEEYRNLRGMLEGGDAGKGASKIQAKASGLCESIERYSGSCHGDEHFITATYDEIKDQAIHPYDLFHFSDSQYDNASSHNKSVSAYNYVPHRFDFEKPVPWTPVWSLTHDTFKYVPTAYLFYDFDPSSAVPVCSNGNAAGNCVEEAILQGFFELVERDAVGIWWYNRIQREEVALETFNNKYVCDLQDYYRSIGYKLWVLDLTTDLGIPVFAGIAQLQGHETENILLGFGAHFDPDIALLRTITEVNQGLCHFLMQDDITDVPNSNVEQEHWYRHITLDSQPYLKPRDGVSRLGRDAFPHQWSNDVKLDVERCVDIVGQLGMEFLVLDQTQPDVELSVVK